MVAAVLEDKRSERRVRFCWPLWYGQDEVGRFDEAKIVDLCRSGVSFTVDAERCPQAGTDIAMRFSFPCGTDEEFAVGSYMNWSSVVRVQPAGRGKCRVAARLHEPLTHELEQAASYRAELVLA